MKRGLLVALAGVGLLVSAVAGAAAFSADPAHSLALFSIQHMGAGNTHGVFTGVTANIRFDSAKPEESSIEVVIKTNSLDTFNEARDKHLSGKDFFDVEKYPEMQFKSTSWKAAGEDTFEITGDFTLHGVTKPITVTAKHTGTGKGRNGETLLGLETKFQIKRSDYDMGAMVPAVGDEVDITVSIEATEH